MRLNRLNLTRYGKFTDTSIEFGERQPGEADLHIVYGPNEAGKSTMLSAFLDLLFGIETKSRFSFLHPYSTMRIGGSLEIGGNKNGFVRVKRLTNSLLDVDERPISESVILAELGGIDRDAYRLMFSLDDDTLEAGGETILASKGDLGQLLFSASAGLADLSQGISDLKAETGAFYRQFARSGGLLDLKAKLATLRQERDAIDTAASQYAQLVAARDQAGAQYRHAIEERSRTQARIDTIQRLFTALPRLTSLRVCRERLLPLADLAPAPPGWAEALPQLQADDTELRTRATSIADDIARLSGDIAGLAIDNAALALTERVDQLAELRARHLTADKDLPDRRLQWREAGLVVDGILSRIDSKGEPDPERLVLGASVVGELRSLIETRSGIEAAAKAADDELVAATRRLNHAKGKLAGLDNPSMSGELAMAALVARLAAIRADDYAARARLATRARATELESLADRLQPLRPWIGTVDELAQMTVPSPAQIEGWKHETTQLHNRVEQNWAEIERLTTDRVRLQAEIEAIGTITGIADDGAAARIRAAREQAWAEHRRTLDPSSADLFEKTLRQDDLVGTTRLAHASDVAKLHQITQALAILNATIERAAQLQREAEADLQRVHEEIATARQTMAAALPADMSLSALEAWLDARTKALETRSDIRSAERDLDEAKSDSENHRSRLKTALAAVGFAQSDDASLETLILSADAAIERAADVRSLRDAVAERERERQTREHDAIQAAAADQAWHTEWSKAVASCWLGDAAATPSLVAVREILSILAGLGPALERQAGLADRIRKMEQDQAEFAAEVGEIAEALGITAKDGAVLELAHAITDQVQEAGAIKARRDEKHGDLERALDAQRLLADKIRLHGQRKAEMTEFFKVDSLAEVGLKLQGIARKIELEAQAEEASREILDALRVSSLEEAERLLDSADHTALDQELLALKAQFEDQDQRSRDLFTAESKATDRLNAVGGDDAVAKIEEQRRTLCLDIEEKALRYLKFRVGTAAAEQALRAYRDRHQSSMMARASAAFRTVSRGAYTGLTAQAEKDGEVLIALGADGGSKLAADLSKGTRFQLYLALRVAGYHEFARSRPSVPFIADDIMETFDDFRAEEAFRLFGEMATVGQVIYLTHHQHLCEIVERACPGARIHKLG